MIADGKTTRHLARRLAALAAAAAALTVLGGCELGNGGGLTGLKDSAGSKDFARGTGSPALATQNT
ncbi:MAG: hypothetical protein JJE27_08310, partial [Thermoleophilia bacterium]|nr:hypothetical protein [Thermoleophilia bacterium]